MHFIALSALLIAATLGSKQPQPLIIIPDAELEITRVGSCLGDREVDLRRVMFLQNSSIDTDGPTGPFRVSLHGETIHIQPLPSGSERGTYVNNVGYAVDPRADIDLNLKLALVDGKLVLYWKETFQYRAYRQGIFEITRQGITEVCQGHGGMSRSH